MLSGLKNQAEIYQKRFADSGDSESFDIAYDVVSLHSQLVSNCKKYEQEKKKRFTQIQRGRLMNQTNRVEPVDLEATIAHNQTQNIVSDVVCVSSSSSLIVVDETEAVGESEAIKKKKERYERFMKQIRFDEVNFQRSNGSYDHLYGTQALRETSLARPKCMRLAKEIPSLAANLPCDYGSSVFVRIDQQRHDLLKFLIIGPESTPYENGLFLFDMYLSKEYPSSPPLCLLCTTGNGKARFNPNLYANGKVCLSLLGTWTGPGWGQHSTILQVMVSIQSLIMVSDPYFNEPGFEKSRGSKAGDQASEGYNKNIRLYTVIYAMKHHLQNPSPYFSDVISTHFRIKREEIITQLKSWGRRAGANSAGGFQKASEEVMMLLQDL